MDTANFGIRSTPDSVMEKVKPTSLIHCLKIEREREREKMTPTTHALVSTSLCQKNKRTSHFLICWALACLANSVLHTHTYLK